MEIERKFLFKSIPFNLEDYPFMKIQQAYVSTKPVIRVRKKETSENKKYILTLKSSGLMMREEYEMNLTEEEYTSLLSKTEGNIITKTRYVIPLEDSLSLELDVFEDDFDGLILGEVEFPDEETSKKYNPPDYINREVTFDTRFHNSTMSTMSKDDILDLISFVHS